MKSFFVHEPRHAISIEGAKNLKLFLKNVAYHWLGDKKVLSSRKLLKQLIGVQR